MKLLRRLLGRSRQQQRNRFPRSCFYCKYFYKDKEHSIKTCHLEEPLTRKDFETVDAPGLCGRWLPAEDAEKRSTRFF